MRKIIAIIFSLTIVLSLVGCGEQKESFNYNAWEAQQYEGLEYLADNDWEPALTHSTSSKAYESEYGLLEIIGAGSTVENDIKLESYRGILDEKVNNIKSTDEWKLDDLHGFEVKTTSKKSGRTTYSLVLHDPVNKRNRTIYFYVSPSISDDEAYREAFKPFMNKLSVYKYTADDKKQDEAKVKEPKPSKPAEPKITTGQSNAVSKANDYIKYMPFSKKGLIGQLEYEGFTNAEASYAVEHIIVNWKEQAVLKAEQYLKSSSFSKQGLIDQLLYEEFTNEEAQYGADKAY